MDKLSIFNNEELLEVYDKIQEEINHLNDNIIIEEDEVEEQPEETPTEESNSEGNQADESESQEEKEEENNE